MMVLILISKGYKIMKKKISVKCFNSKVYEMKKNYGKFIKK